LIAGSLKLRIRAPSHTVMNLYQVTLPSVSRRLENLFEEGQIGELVRDENAIRALEAATSTLEGRDQEGRQL